VRHNPVLRYREDRHKEGRESFCYAVWRKLMVRIVGNIIKPEISLTLPCWRPLLIKTTRMDAQTSKRQPNPIDINQ